MLSAVTNQIQQLVQPQQTEKRTLFDKFKVDTQKKYGEGGYGATYAATDLDTNQRLAVKIIDTRRMKIEAIKKETTILEMLNHHNVIKVHGHGTGPPGSAQVSPSSLKRPAHSYQAQAPTTHASQLHLPDQLLKKSSYSPDLSPVNSHTTLQHDAQEHLYFIFMELADGGELFDQVIDRGVNAMPEDVARNFFQQMLAGVLHCHERGVAHRDLKLENVLLTGDGVVKIIDFGLSHVYAKTPAGDADRSKPLSDMCGSKSYAAPEVLGSKGYDGFSADVWSLGVSLFAMLSGFFPLDEATGKDWRYGKLLESQIKGRSTTRTVYSWYRRTCNHLSP